MPRGIVQLEPARTLTHPNAVYGVSFSRDGKRLASACLDNTARLWNVADGANAETLRGHNDGVAFVDFLKDGRVVTASLDGTLKVWSADGKLQGTLSGHQGYLTCAAISHSGTLLASGGMDKSVRLWDAQTDTAVAVFTGHEDAVQSVALAPDDRLAASAGDDNSIRIWEVEGKKLERAFPAHSAAVEAVVFAPKGDLIASAGGDGRIKFWTRQGAPVADISGRSPRVKSLAFSPDGALLASGAADGTVRLWRMSDPEHTAVAIGHRNTVYAVAFNPSGTMLASAGFDRDVRLWNIRG